MPCARRSPGTPPTSGATKVAFRILHRELERRLAAGKLVVVDATNAETHARRALTRRAAQAGAPAIAIVLDLPPTRRACPRRDADVPRASTPVWSTATSRRSATRSTGAGSPTTASGRSSSFARPTTVEAFVGGDVVLARRWPQAVEPDPDAGDREDREPDADRVLAGHPLLQQEAARMTVTTG